MAFRRSPLPATLFAGDQLTGRMVGIGMNFAAPAIPDANIEDTLVAASVEGIERNDFRVLAVLTTWLGVHSPQINVDRLFRIVASQESKRVRAFWAAVARWKGTDRRFARVARVHRGNAIDLLPTGTDFQIRRRGEDVRFVASKLRVPAGVLRDRAADVLTPAELAHRHRAYRFRLIIGPSYRADAWAAFDAAPDLSIAELARRSYASFATAWQVAHDARLLAPDRESHST